MNYLVKYEADHLNFFPQHNSKITCESTRSPSTLPSASSQPHQDPSLAKYFKEARVSQKNVFQKLKYLEIKMINDNVQN